MPLKIMSLTDAAVERINEIIDDSATPVMGVRVQVLDLLDDGPRAVIVAGPRTG